MSTSTAPTSNVPSALTGQTESAAYIDRQLARTGRQVKIVDLISAAMIYVTAAAVFFLVAVVIDHWVFGLGVWGRSLAFAMFFGGTAWFVAAQAMVAWRRINPVYAARVIEQSAPTLKNSLVNLLLFRSNGTPIQEVLFDALRQKAASDLNSVPVESVVDRTRLIKLGYVLAGVVGICAGYKILSPKDPLKTVSRVIAPWANIQRPSRVNILDVTPGNKSVFYGQQVKVVARLEVHGIRTLGPVTLVYSTADDRILNQTIAMSPISSAEYEAILPPGTSGVRQDLRYHITVEDAISPEYQLTVLPAPTILVDRIELTYPSYTGRPREVLERQGNIRAIEGTRVTIHAKASEPIRAASIEFDPLDEVAKRNAVAKDPGKSKAPQRLAPLAMKVDGISASGSFVLELAADRKSPKYSSYQARFVSEQGISSDQPVLHQIQVLPDLPPEIEILTPTQDRVEVAEAGRQKIEVRAIDPDFGISKIVLRAVAGNTDVLTHEMLKDSRGRSGQNVVSFDFAPRSLHLAVGDEVRFWAIAEDSRTNAKTGLPEPNIQRTREYHLRVVKNPDGPANDNGNNPNPDAANPPPDEKQSPKQQPDPSQKSKDKNGSKDSSGADGKNGDQEKESQKQGDSGSGGSKSGDKPNDSKQPDQGKNGQGKNNQGNQKDKSGQNSSQQSSDKPQSGNESGSGQKQDPKDNSSGSNGNQQQNGGQQGNSSQKGNSKNQGQGDAKNSESQDGGGKNSSGKSTGQQPSKDGSGNEPAEKGGDQAPPPGSSSREQPADPGAKASGTANDSSAKGTPSGDTEPRTENSPNGEGGDGKNSKPNSKRDAKPTEKLHDGEVIERALDHLKNKPQNDPQKKQNDNKSNSNDAGGDSQNASGSSPQKADSKQPMNNGENSAGQSPDSKQPPPGGEKKQNPNVKPNGGGAAERNSPNAESKNGPSKENGAAGAGNSQQKNPGDAESKNKDPMQSQNSDARGAKPNTADDAKSSSQNKKEADSAQHSDGVEKKGQKKGGGQGANQQSNDSSGSKSSADEGAGQSSDRGQGETSNKGGDRKTADKPTGTAGSEKGNGSQSKPGEGAAEDGSPSDKEKSAKKAATSSAPGKGGGEPLGGGAPSNNQTGKATSPSNVPDGDEANLEHARKATEMVLEYLKDQKDNPDRELLDKLGWTQDDLQKFLDRWQAMKRAAGDPQKKEAAREFDDSLRSLGLRPQSDRVRSGNTNSDAQRGNRDAGARSAPPSSYQDQFNAFRKGTARAKDE